MKAVQFGAGNIGRGFIGDILFESGYEITFIDVADEIIEGINASGSYDLYLIDHQYKKKVISGVRAVSSVKQEEQAVKAILEADVITTSVWANNLPRIAPVLAKGLKARLDAGRPRINVLACENAMFGTQILKQAMIDCDVEITEAELNRAGAYPNTAVDRVVLGTNKDGKMAVNIADYHELAVEETKLVDPEIHPIKDARYTDNLQKFLERKLYVINCGHAWAGYIGYVHGYKSARDVFMDPELVDGVKKAMTEAAELIYRKYDFSHDEMMEYVDFGVKRYQAEGVDYEVSMVTRSPIRKLNADDRMAGPCIQCEEMGLSNEYLMRGLALILCLDNGDEQAVRMQEYIKEYGVENAIEHYTSIKRDSNMNRRIVEYYGEYCRIRDQHR